MLPRGLKASTVRVVQLRAWIRWITSVAPGYQHAAAGERGDSRPYHAWSETAGDCELPSGPAVDLACEPGLAERPRPAHDQDPAVGKRSGARSVASDFEAASRAETILSRIVQFRTGESARIEILGIICARRDEDVSIVE